nr:hypothetical protein [Tanacetum cinerariifolium]
MKHWKSGFFLIDRRAIPDAMVWRHLDAAIHDLRPTAGSFNMADVRLLSAYVIKLRDMPEVYWFCLVMRIHDFLCLPEWTDAVIPNLTLEDLAVGTPSSKILATAELLRSERPLLLVSLQAMLLRVLDSRGKGIMVDDAATPSGGVSRQRPSSGPASSFRDVSGDAIHTYFFHFSAGPYYDTYPEDGIAGNYEFT